MPLGQNIVHESSGTTDLVYFVGMPVLLLRRWSLTRLFDICFLIWPRLEGVYTLGPST